MRRASSFLLLLFLLPLGLVHAEDEMEWPAAPPKVLEMSRATVLASPGVPTGLRAYLPGSRAPGTIAWPLPKGSLLLLGLPASDPIARRVCDVYQLDVDDLAGGYRIWAWRADRRSMVFVMGADAAALQSARFEFDASAPSEMTMPGMRSLDFKRPNQQAGVTVRVGTRHVKPRYRMRAWSSWDAPRRGDALLAAGARANRVWLEAPDVNAASIQRIEALRAQGVTPVISAGVYGQLSGQSLATWTDLSARMLGAWQKRAGIRHFALVFDATASSIRMEGAKARDHESAIVKGLLERLRPGGIDELVVVPRCHSDRLAKVAGAPPDLSGYPEVITAWSGPTEFATRITRAQAERRVKEAGTPVVLLDTWAMPITAPSLIPALPHGRAADLHEVLDGIVVLGRRGAEDVLESAWQNVDQARFGMAELTPLLPAKRDDAAAFLAGLATNLRKADKEGLGLVPWMAPFAKELEAAQARTAAYGRWVAFQRGDPWIVTLAAGEGQATIHAQTDGRVLRFEARIPPAAIPKGAAWLFRLRLKAPGRSDQWMVEATPEGPSIDSTGLEGTPHLEPGHITCTQRNVSGVIRIEITFDRFALGGEPHAGRLFEVAAFWGPSRIWPAKGPDGAVGALVITR